MASSAPTDAEIMSLAETVADRMGRVSAMYTYANQLHQAGQVKKASFVIAQIPEDWVPLLHDLHSVGH